MNNHPLLRSIHPFPARMAPSIVWQVLSSRKRRARVLDPMSGSGTTLAVARMRGHEVIGFDSDPLAVLISQVWCSHIDKEKLELEATSVIDRARHNYRGVSLAEAYPSGADD